MVKEAYLQRWKMFWIKPCLSDQRELAVKVAKSTLENIVWLLTIGFENVRIMRRLIGDLICGTRHL